MKRLEALDTVRCLVFCGMVLVIFRIAAQVTPDQNGANTLVDAIAGRADALFIGQLPKFWPRIEALRIGAALTAPVSRA